MSRISGDEEVTDDFIKGSLSTVMGFEDRLKGFIEIILRHVMMKLGSNCSFQNFTHKGKVGDRTVVIEVSRVHTGLFENRGNYSCFEAIGYQTRYQTCL